MKSELSRRDFLKLAALAPMVASGLSPSFTPIKSSHQGDEAPNILILVFDALSAHNISMYGYHRATTPNLARFAENAHVYHNNYAGGNFTSSGTASLLTGTYPWTHRALQLHGTVEDSLADHNIFKQFADRGYTRVAYSHNYLATSLLYQFRADIENLKWTRDLCLSDNQFSDILFSEDFNVAFWSEWLTMRGGSSGEEPGSLFLSLLQRMERSVRKRSLLQQYGELFPRGIPSLHNMLFVLEDAIDWVIGQLATLPNPYLLYFHVLPPHEPYTTRNDFIDRFKDGWNPEPKPISFFSEGHEVGFLNKNRREYDEYLGYADAEFGRLFDAMVKNGTLDNTYVIFTSDHGELFERGIRGHVTSALYQPVVHVPLAISQPGQLGRVDIYEPTSCVDIIPTLLHLTDRVIPSWCEGEILPPFRSNNTTNERSIFTVEAKRNPKQAPLTKDTTVSMINGKHKLIYYTGFKEDIPKYEMYDIDNDPEERVNLASSQKSLSDDLYGIVLDKLAMVNSPYT